MYCCCSLAAKSCLTLCYRMYCSPPGSSVHRISQAKNTGVPFPSPGDLSNPGIEPESPTLAGQFFTTESQSLGVCYASLNSRPCPHRPFRPQVKFHFCKECFLTCPDRPGPQSFPFPLVPSQKSVTILTIICSLLFVTSPSAVSP